MAWKTTGDIVTAADLNSTAPGVATTAGRRIVTDGVNTVVERVPTVDAVDTNESTASTSYTDLTTTGPAVTVTTGTKAIVHFGAELYNSSGGGRSRVAVAVSGASTIAASDAKALQFESSNANDNLAASRTVMFTSLTAGSNTFTLKYNVATGTGNFLYRHIIVDPL